MKKKILSPFSYLTILFVFVFSSAFSQDDIIMRNDDVVKAKVEEVGVNVIKYRKAENPDGPLYDMPKSNVYMIVYSNGSRDVINERGGDGPPPANNGGSVQADAPIREAPPEMPVYEQPACPVAGYLWTPGYWGWGLGGYYWVPGLWANPPQVGYLWTPGYWGYAGGFYGFHDGYWGEHIGFYGGVNYGYGYGGTGFYGGRWEGGAFMYNTAVSRVDVTVVHTTYVDRTVVHTTSGSRASFNGAGGIRADATPAERMAASERHMGHTPEQASHVNTARSDRSQYASANGGKPAVTAMNRANGQHFGAEGHPATPHPNSQPQPQRNTNNPQQHTNTPATQTHNNNPAPQQQHNNPAPQQTHNNNPAPQQQHNNPAPQQQHNNPAPQHYEPAPQHNNPAPQQQHNNPAPQQQHSSPAPQQQHSSPAPQRSAPAPQRSAPAQHSTPAPTHTTPHH